MRKTIAGVRGTCVPSPLGRERPPWSPSLLATIACGLDLFGPEQVVFGSDCPFDPEGGPPFIREIIAAIDARRRIGRSEATRAGYLKEQP